MRDFPEGDWKRLRALEEEALDAFLERVLIQASGIIALRDGDNRQAYGQLCRKP